MRMTAGSSPPRRLRDSGVDLRCRAGLAFLPCPAGVLGIPRRIALLDGLECPRCVVSGGVGTEPVLRGTHVVPGLDPVVPETPEIAAPARPTVVHEITVHLKPTKRYRFGQKVQNFQCGLCRRLPDRTTKPARSAPPGGFMRYRHQPISAATSSAIWTALSAAPLRRLSLERNSARPFSAVSSARIRPT